MHPPHVGLERGPRTRCSVPQIDVVEVQTTESSEFVRLPRHQVLFDDALGDHLDDVHVTAVEPRTEERSIEAPRVEPDPRVLGVFDQLCELFEVAFFMVPKRLRNSCFDAFGT